MRRRVPGCGVVVCALVLAAVRLVARGESVVSWQAAASYVGDVVTVEGDVARAHLEADTCVLEFSPTDSTAFRVVLLIPLITDLPRQPQRLYEGKRVRATGMVRSWQGRPEMILRSPSDILVVGVSGAPAGTAPSITPTPPTTIPAAPPPPPRTTPPTTAPAPVPSIPSTLPSTIPAPAAPVSPPPAPVPTTPPTTVPPPVEEEEPPHLPRAIDPCDAARERWRRAAAELEARAGDLTRCLRAGSYRCRQAASAMAPALSELEWAEQKVEAACP